MRIVCMTNEAQLPMMKSMLNSAMKSGIPMNLFHCYILTGNKDSAAYATDAFKTLAIKKLKVILANMALDREVIWVDNDIVFFQNCIDDMRSKRTTFVHQDDYWAACGGFFLVRSGPFSKQVIQKSIDWLPNCPSYLNDQHAINKFSAETMGVTVTKLPMDEYPNGSAYFELGIKSKAKMVHCNCLHTTNEKLVRLKENGLWDESDTGYIAANKYLISL